MTILSKGAELLARVRGKRFSEPAAASETDGLVQALAAGDAERESETARAAVLERADRAKAELRAKLVELEATAAEAEALRGELRTARDDRAALAGERAAALRALDDRLRKADQVIADRQGRLQAAEQAGRQAAALRVAVLPAGERARRERLTKARKAAVGTITGLERDLDARRGDVAHWQGRVAKEGKGAEPGLRGSQKWAAAAEADLAAGRVSLAEIEAQILALEPAAAGGAP